MLDLLIAGGEVLDGTGGPAMRADVGVRAGRIAEVGDLAGRRAARRLDAEGQIVCPGFIDMHSHDDFNLPVNPGVPGKTVQGVTTQVTGNCGFSPAPLAPQAVAAFAGVSAFLNSGLDFSWRSMAAFLEALPPLGCNVAQLVGHIPVRCSVMGMEDRAPTAGELQGMQALVAESMQAGAFGFSTGLSYPPCCYADTDEIVALNAVAVQHGGGYHTHMRDPRLGVFESTREALEIGRRCGGYVQVSHIKLASHKHWGRAAELMGLLDEAQAGGLRVGCDAYPYLAGGGSLHSGIPAWAMAGGVAGLVQRLADPALRARIREEVLAAISAGGSTIPGWERIELSQSATHPEWVGLTMTEVAQREGKAPIDSFLDLIAADRGDSRKISFIMDEADLRTILRHPCTAIGSDGFITSGPDRPELGRPHPRYYGTFPRVLGHYVREDAVLALPQAVHKMTGLPARTLDLRQRGELREGWWADLVVFNPATVADRATYEEPLHAPEGITAVLVNGVLTAENGHASGTTAGQVLRRASSSAAA